MTQDVPGLQVTDAGPFHGDEEGYARLYTVIAAMGAVAALALPWVNLLLLHHRAGSPHASSIWINTLSATVVSTTSALTYVAAYKRLGRLVARGGPDSKELDRLRRLLATFASGVYTLVWLVWWSGILSR